MYLCYGIHKRVKEKVAFSRAKGGHVYKRENRVDHTPFKCKMIEKIVKKLAAGTPGVLDLSTYTTVAVPKTFHGNAKPTLDEMREKHFSRFSSSGK